MSTVTILGTGAMGSALATPISSNGHRVRLWGTHHDDFRIDALVKGEAHPGTGVPTPENAEFFRDAELDAALDGSDAVVVAVTSVGVGSIMRRASARIGDTPILLTSKGFHRGPDGSVSLMPEAIREALGQPDRPIVGIGGPCKADEVADGRFTATVYASRDLDLAESTAAILDNPRYRVEVSDDEIGLEICAPLKNVYTIALGFAEGMQQRTGTPWHNLRSALFARAAREMASITSLAGGRERTAFGLAGVGDLEVTALSGRNKLFGQRLGAGETASKVRADMEAAGLVVEGIGACGPGLEFARRVGADSHQIALIEAISRILEGAEPLEAITEALAA